MLFLVLADDLLFVYLGWEGVGLCSCLLIGFYKDRNSGAAALKAFVVTRAGDVFLAIGLFVLYRELGASTFTSCWCAPPRYSQAPCPVVRLPDAARRRGRQIRPAARCRPGWRTPSGPTPVSALIHAATMVTAGVYPSPAPTASSLLAPGSSIWWPWSVPSPWCSPVCRPGADRHQADPGFTPP